MFQVPAFSSAADEEPLILPVPVYVSVPSLRSFQPLEIVFVAEPEIAMVPPDATVTCPAAAMLPPDQIMWPLTVRLPVPFIRLPDWEESSNMPATVESPDSRTVPPNTRLSPAPVKEAPSMMSWMAEVKFSVVALPQSNTPALTPPPARFSAPD